MVLIKSFVRDTVEMMTAGNKSRQTVQGRGSASVVNDTTVEVAAHLSLMVAVVVAVIISIIVLLAGSG